MKTLILLTSAVFLTAPVFADNEELKSDHMMFGANLGTILPSKVGAADYTASPAFGVSFEYKPQPWFSIGGATHTAFVLANTSGANTLFEGAILAQGLLYLGDTGIYAGLRAGLSDISVSFSNWRPLYFIFAWGPRVGYQYRIPDSNFSIGPQFDYLLFSSGTSVNTDPLLGTKTTLPSHEEVIISIAGKMRI